MTSGQKIIKYFALALAIFLIVSIISLIFKGISMIGGLKGDDDAISENMKKLDVEQVEKIDLDINLAATSLTIKKGDSIYAETNNKYIELKQKDNKIEIKEGNHNWFLRNNKTEAQLVIYLPESIEIEKVNINSGAGVINIESLSCKNLTFEIGAGEVKLDNINVSKECKIEGGAGKLSILSGNINDLDLEMGVGEVDIYANITGKSDIEAGVGKLNIKLTGEKDSYKIKAKKGLGDIEIDNKKISDNEVFGDGDNYIKVDGGVGEIDITFE